jgi:polyisoprenoid-binding protein YceI
VILHSTINPIPTPEGTIVRYRLDATASRFRAQAYATGLLAAFGHNPIIAIREFSGDAVLDAGSLEQSSLQVTIKTASFEVENDMSSKDRSEILQTIHDDVLDVENYPEIRYESKSFRGRLVSDARYWIVVSGNLSLHGVTRPLDITTSLVVNGETCRASGEFFVRQSDYKIRPPSAVGGGLKVKDEIKCSFDIVARKTV